jgi:hypothetical protein
MVPLSQLAEVVRHSGPVAAGATLITPSAGVDCNLREGCLFLVGFGAIVADGVQSIEVHESLDDGDQDAYALIAGTNVVVADTADNKVAYVDVRRVTKRWLKCLVNRATQNSTVEFITAMPYGGRRRAVTQPVASVSGGKAGPAYA